MIVLLFSFVDFVVACLVPVCGFSLLCAVGLVCSGCLFWLSCLFIMVCYLFVWGFVVRRLFCGI